MPEQLGGRVLHDESARIVHHQLSAGAPEVTPAVLQRLEDGGLLAGETGEPVTAAAVAKDETEDEDLRHRPVETDQVFRPVELRLLPRPRLETLGRVRGGGLRFHPLEEPVEARLGTVIAALRAQLGQDPAAAHALEQAGADEVVVLALARRRGGTLIDGGCLAVQGAVHRVAGEPELPSDAAAGVAALV